MEKKGLKQYFGVDFGNGELSGCCLRVEYDEISKTIFVKTPKRIPGVPFQ